MNLRNKTELASKVLKVGKNRIKFDKDRLSEIKEAITKQDIKDLYKDGFITIKPINGRKKIKRRKTKRGPGKIKKRVNKRKQIYVKLVRKLKKYLKELKNQGKIERELYIELRKKIRMRNFKSKAHLKEYLENTEKIDLSVIKKKKVSKKENVSKKIVKKTKIGKDEK